MLLDVYSRLLRPILFLLPPEAAQKMAEMALRRRVIWRAASRTPELRDSRLSVDLLGLKLKNPVGLAAGFDKNCELLPSLAALGFGYLVGGTVTELPRPGNPKPRMLRLTDEESLVNSLGFPGKGLEYAARRLEVDRPSLGDTRLVVSVSGSDTEEIVRCHRRLEPLADALEVNISSPNTEGLRVFHEPEALKRLIGRVNDGRDKPLSVKLPPYPSTGDGGHRDEAVEAVLSLAATCSRAGVDGLTVANTRPVGEPRLATGHGGLSGRAIFGRMLDMVADVRAEVGSGPAINACGGIFNGEDAWRALAAGATTVQLYTGLVYRGPWVVKKMARELLRAMEREGAPSTGSLPPEEPPPAAPG